MIDAERMLGSLVRSALSSRGGRRRSRRRRGHRRQRRALAGVGKGALALGALGVAMAAFEHYSRQKSAASPATGAGSVPPPPPGPPPADLPPLPPLPTEAAPAPEAQPQGDPGDALLLVRAMIAAANADHELDDDERARILEALEQADGSEEDKEFLRGELENPIGLAALAAAAATPELASQIYLASCLAIEIDTSAERAYLDRLAAKLGLEPERARELESLVESSP